MRLLLVSWVSPSGDAPLKIHSFANVLIVAILAIGHAAYAVRTERTRYEHEFRASETPVDPATMRVGHGIILSARIVCKRRQISNDGAHTRPLDEPGRAADF